jgi:hypothetical protein
MVIHRPTTGEDRTRLTGRLAFIPASKGLLPLDYRHLAVDNQLRRGGKLLESAALALPAVSTQSLALALVAGVLVDKYKG